MGPKLSVHAYAWTAHLLDRHCTRPRAPESQTTMAQSARTSLVRGCYVPSVVCHSQFHPARSAMVMKVGPRPGVQELRQAAPPLSAGEQEQSPCCAQPRVAVLCPPRRIRAQTQHASVPLLRAWARHKTSTSCIRRERLCEASGKAMCVCASSHKERPSSLPSLPSRATPQQHHTCPPKPAAPYQRPGGTAAETGAQRVRRSGCSTPSFGAPACRVAAFVPTQCWRAWPEFPVTPN